MNRRQFFLTSLAAAAARPIGAAETPLFTHDDRESSAKSQVTVLLVDTDRVLTPISDGIYGQFLEHINHSVEDGIFAEQIRGAGFEGEDFKAYWMPFADHGEVQLVDVAFNNGKHCVRLHIAGGHAGVRQRRVFLEDNVQV